jgi:hypothetical protein
VWQRRPESEAVLDREQLAEFTRRLQMLSDDGVEKIYQTAYKDCALNRQQLPPAARHSATRCVLAGIEEV